MVLNYDKNAVKLLPKIDNSENKVVLYTEYDGNFEVGDKLFIMVNDDTSSEYTKLDSYYNSGYTYDKLGYTLLSKFNNKLTLDINYDNLGLSIISSDNCYIGTVYLKNSAISKGIINATMFYNTNISSTNISTIDWKQGVIFSSSNTIKNIYFKKKYDSSDKILKARINSSSDVEYFYSENEYNNTLNHINLTTNILGIENCNIDEGIFKNCQFIRSNQSQNVIINNGTFEDCILSGKYTINDGYFKNSTMTTTVIWNNGRWYSPVTGLSGDTNNYLSTEWKSGTWENGYFPTGITWKEGRFLNGYFNGTKWEDGYFNGGTFNSSLWEGGTFNDGTMNSGVTWQDGTVNNGNLVGITWEDGTFNGGAISGSTWTDGTFNDGTVTYTTWKDGTFNDGEISYSTWQNGKFYDGVMNNCTWNNGNFYNGTFNNSDWINGNFYNGTIFDSNWTDGNMFFGKINLLNWSGGTWYDGVANNIDFYDGVWHDGIFNYGNFYGGRWKNGTFNSGVFKNDSVWENGKFYFGDFESTATWIKGTFYLGKYSYNVPRRDIIGKKFVQYNKKGLVKKLNISKRTPKFKRF